jgi:DNA replication protein DnaC
MWRANEANEFVADPSAPRLKHHACAAGASTVISSLKVRLQSGEDVVFRGPSGAGKTHLTIAFG